MSQDGKDNILDSGFVKELAIVIGVPLGLFAVVALGYLIFDLLV